MADSEVKTRWEAGLSCNLQGLSLLSCTNHHGPRSQSPMAFPKQGQKLGQSIQVHDASQLRSPHIPEPGSSQPSVAQRQPSGPATTAAIDTLPPLRCKLPVPCSTPPIKTRHRALACLSVFYPSSEVAFCVSSTPPPPYTKALSWDPLCGVISGTFLVPNCQDTLLLQSPFTWARGWQVTLK